MYSSLRFTVGHTTCTPLVFIEIDNANPVLLNNRPCVCWVCAWVKGSALNFYFNCVSVYNVSLK